VADAPWRCSQCGTVNAPSANACRSCGRWPSLFDLQSGAVETETAAEPTFDDPEELPDAPTYADEPPVADASRSGEEQSSADIGGSPRADGSRTEPAPSAGPNGRGSGAPWRGPEPSIPRTPQGTWMRRATRLIVPILVLLYVLISSLRH
jgi:hypothetical protein